MTDEIFMMILESICNHIHKKSTPTFIEQLLAKSLDFIKRQQAEIEHFRDLTKKIKTEAIKEVTAELYNSFAQYETYDRHHTFEILDKIQSVEDFLFDNLVKELKEGK